MLDFSSLNNNQLEAVNWEKGALLVLAGPGSGKTRVLTYRIARILEDSPNDYFRVLALTFTNKAAAEIRSRVEELIPGALGRVRLTTFHSYAAEILQMYGSRINLKSNFYILSNNNDRIALLDDVISDLYRNLNFSLPKHFQANQILPSINQLLEQCVPPIEKEILDKLSNTDNSFPLAQVYIAYRKALHKSNCLDYPSLIAELIELLTNFPYLVTHIRQVFTHILVDEFQDTNQSQYRILSLLTKPDPSTLFVVADDDQIIYQWNGASPKRIQDLKDDFNVSQLQLPENYRCPQKVIELANALIENNHNRSVGKKPLIAVKQGDNGDSLRIIRFTSLGEECEWIAKDIARKPLEERAASVVLARTKKFLDLIGKKLEEVDIPAYFATRKDEFNSAPLKMLHSILHLANSQENIHYLSYLSKAFFEIKGVNIELSTIISNSYADDKDFLRTWLGEINCLQKIDAQTFNLLNKDIKPLLDNLNYRPFIDNFLVWAQSINLNSISNANYFDEFEEELCVWNSLLSEIFKKFNNENISLHQFLNELDLNTKSTPKKPNAVPCFTIHASKGLEFNHVYLMGLIEDQLPIWNAIRKGENSLEMQEERRNCFVAITRAQKTLTMTFARENFGWEKKPSRFLKEMHIEI